MKILNYLAVLCIAVFAAACSNDDDEPKTGVDLSGTYNVDAAFYVGKPSGEATPVSVVLEVKGGVATLKTPALGEGRMSIKPMTITDIAVTKVSDNTYTFKKAAFDLPLEGITYHEVTVSEKSVISDGKMNFELSVKPGEMPMSFTLIFVSK